MADTNPQVFLSAEERAALAEPDDDTPSAEAADGAEINAQDGGDAGQDSYQPLLVVREIPQAGEALAALDGHAADLQARFDEGDITSSEMAAGLREVQRARNEIEWAQRKNELAVEMQQTHEDEKWEKAVRSFMSKEGVAIAKNEGLVAAFDSIVRRVTSNPENASLSFRKQLEKAHKIFTDDVARAGFLFDGSFDDTSAGGASTNFAALDRLADTNPTRFEREFAKLSANDQAAYLES